MNNLLWYDYGFLSCIHSILRECPHVRTQLHKVISPLLTSSQSLGHWIHPFDSVTTRQMYERAFYMLQVKKKRSEHELKYFGRYVIEDDDFFTSVQRRMIGFVSDAVGEPVEVSYNFMTLYVSNGSMAIHLDHPEAKYTVNHILDTNVEWPLYVSDVNTRWQWRYSNKNRYRRFVHTPNSENTTLIFSGSAQWHYRDPIPQYGRDRKPSFSMLVFFHFLPRGMVNVSNETRLRDIFCPHIHCNH